MKGSRHLALLPPVLDPATGEGVRYDARVTDPVPPRWPGGHDRANRANPNVGNLRCAAPFASLHADTYVCLAMVMLPEESATGHPAAPLKLRLSGFRPGSECYIRRYGRRARPRDAGLLPGISGCSVRAACLMNSPNAELAASPRLLRSAGVGPLQTSEVTS